MAAEQRWWRELGFVPWIVLKVLLPGAALFTLLVWLSLRFVRDGFADTRQHAFAPSAGSLTAPVQKNWWSCTCVGACACLAALAHGLRRCCIERSPVQSLA